MITVYVSIGNSDDKLTQQEWWKFLTVVNVAIRGRAIQVHGQWFSSPWSKYQNACWCFEINNGGSTSSASQLRRQLSRIAATYKQDSIAWAVAQTHFIKPAKDTDERRTGQRSPDPVQPEDGGSGEQEAGPESLVPVSP